MFKNNLLVQFINLLIINISFALFLLLSTVLQLHFKYSSIITFAVSTIFYGVFTYFLIPSNKDYLDNIKSLISLPLLSLIFSVANLLISSYMFDSTISSIPFDIYNFYSLPLINYFNISNPLISIIFSIIPFIVCLLTLLLKPSKTSSSTLS